MLNRVFKSASPRHVSQKIYVAIVAAARQPVLYDRLRVPDTLDGRFDMLALFGFLVMERLNTGSLKPLAQALADTLFAQLDRDLREMGVGDQTVPKRVRAMAEIFYGRAAAYAQALTAPDLAPFAAALARNVYAGEEDGGALARHALAVRRHLAGLGDAGLATGDITFPELAP